MMTFNVPQYSFKLWVNVQHRFSRDPDVRRQTAHEAKLPRQHRGAARQVVHLANTAVNGGLKRNPHLWGLDLMGVDGG